MSGVRVLVGTKKGAFVLSADANRKKWKVDGPHFEGWEIYHMKGSPADPNRLYASQSSGWFGDGVVTPTRSIWPWSPRRVDALDLFEDARHHAVASWSLKRKGCPALDASALVQGFAEQHPSSVQASLRGFLGDVETVSGLGCAHAFDLTHHEHRPIVLRQRLDRGFDQPA